MRSRLVINPAATGDTAADQVEQPTRATGEIRERPGRELPERRHRAVIGGQTTSYRLPRRPGFAFGGVSGDGRTAAFPLERARQGPAGSTLEAGYPIPPSDIAVLRFDSGRLDLVPGIELPGKAIPAMAFSGDDHWLVLALDAGSRTRLLAWRRGLHRPLESAPIPGQVVDPAPLTVQP